MKGGSTCSVEKKMSRSNSASSSSLSRGRRCRCGEKLLFFTTHNDKNPGRHFWRCPLWDTQGSCNFFQWADDEVTEETYKRYEQALEDLLVKNAKLKSKPVAERKVGIVKMGFVVLSWSVSFALLGYCVVKCNCNIQ
ncbi:Zinc finger, GRF-type [Sesbania bispinosa]|nr:Zinc finger, GRF-type [Sesbania bispinosa]